METTETKVSYFFQGDDRLPFQLADPGDSISAPAAGWRDRLTEWLGGETVLHGKVDSGVAIGGAVYVGAGTRIHAGVDIQGPAYIGENCSIRHGAEIRPGTILSNDCVVGHAAEIKNSICMAGAKMQSHVFVGDSILGLGARIGSGTILANRRFTQDEVLLGGKQSKLPTGVEFFGAVIGDYVRLGANVVTLPGTVIGPYTWVSPLISLHGFVPRAKLVMLRQDLVFLDKGEEQLRSGHGDYEKS